MANLVITLAIKKIKEEGTFEDSLFGCLSAHTDIPWRSGFHVQSCQHLRITRKNTIFEVAERHYAWIYLKLRIFNAQKCSFFLR